MLHSISQLAFKLIKKRNFGVKTSIFNHRFRNVIMDVITCPENLQTTSGLLTLMHDVISLRDAISCDNCT